MSLHSRFSRRLIDVIFSLGVLLLTFPILIICAIAIKLDSKGPILFIHERTGLFGKSFKMYKLRGMIDNALNYGPVLTQENDPRLTRVGKILRRTSLDEIPNFINVLFGDMSVVGPRPEMPSITAKYNSAQREIFNYKPGVTGYSQINGRQKLTPEERVKMELNYYCNSNFFSDLNICFKTISVILKNAGNI